jgi:hypothetical protein
MDVMLLTVIFAILTTLRVVNPAHIIILKYLMHLIIINADIIIPIHIWPLLPQQVYQLALLLEFSLVHSLLLWD